MQCRVIFKMQRTVVQCVLEFPQVGKCDLQYFTDNLQLQPFHQEQEDFPCQPIGKWHIRRPEPGQVAMSSVKLVAYTHLRAHETDSYLVCRLLLEKKKPQI